MRPRLGVAGQGGQSMDRLTRTLTQALWRGQTPPIKKTTFKKHPQKLQKLFDPTPTPSHTAKNTPTFLKTGYPCTYQKLSGLLHNSNRIPLYIHAKPAPSAQKRAQRVGQRVGVAQRVSDMRLFYSYPSTQSRAVMGSASERWAA